MNHMSGNTASGNTVTLETQRPIMAFYAEEMAAIGNLSAVIDVLRKRLAPILAEVPVTSQRAENPTSIPFNSRAASEAFSNLASIKSATYEIEDLIDRLEV